MSDILCRWLNQDLRLSKIVEPKTFAKDFSSGYLIGEVLHKYQLQNDFSMFMKKDTSISRLNNFTRLEPTLQLLGISFDINTAQELMQEKQGVATRLLYQLYISLEKKKSTEISGTMMEIMLPAANAELHKKEHDIYSDRLHQVVKRDAELKLQKISQHYEKKFQQLNEKSVVTHSIQQKRQLKVQHEKRMKNIEKRRVFRQKHSGIMSWIQATAVQVPRPPPNNSQLILKKRLQQQQRRQQQAQKVQIEIAQFETNRKKLITTGFASFSSGQSTLGDFPFAGTSEIPESGTKMILQSSSKYIEEIRQRLEENAVAREQREKRRDRFLVEQLKAHEAQEEARREEQLVKRLTRQTQQEQRLAAQLLQLRMQKEVIRENRLFREQQYQQRRERDFQEALAREAALAQQAKLDHAEEIRKEVEFFNRIAAERAQRKYQKHFKSCKDILDQIVDLATKVGEYRLLTGNLIPEKLMREWKELLFSGLPLYEPKIGQQPGFEFSSSLDPLELKKQETLNNQDYDEYANMVDEWAWPEEEEAGATTLPPTNNNILGHIIQRLRNIVHPPVMEPSSPSFPHFTLKACVLGKFCSGKTTCLTKIAKAHGIYVLSADRLIKEALNSYRRGEEVTEQQGEKTNEQLLTSSSSVKSDSDTQEEGKEGNIRLSTLAMQGAAAEKELRNCSGITNELLVGIIVEAIRQLPAHSGWILDGFPVDITQAYLLEKALGGSVDIGNDIDRSRTNLAADPNPPKPPLPAPVLDLALLLDIPDESVITRAFNHTDSSHPTDKTLYLAQIPHRITAFQDTWPKLEKWFGEKQNILVCVDASVDEEELYRRVDSVLQHVLMQTQKDLASNLVEDVMDNGKATTSSSSATRLSVDQHQPVTDEAPAEKAQSVMSLSKSNTHSPRGKSENASTSSVTNEDSQEVPKNPSESASPYPCLSSWAYVDEPLPLEVSEYLCSYWDTVCDSYVNNIKTAMQQLRSQHTDINHHLFNIREKFKHFLHRPDLKQELVSQWQNDFNSIADDMREDEDTKADLHVRLDELRERLWDISDKRKEQDQQKRADIMGSGWLEEHTALLIKHHSTLMRVELDRFQETLSVLRVYYMSMYKPVLPEPPSNFACIPLLDTLKIKDQDKSINQADASVSSQMDDGEDKRKTKSIPVLPRRPDSSGEASKLNDLGQIEPVKPSQEKLVSDYEEALRAIGNLMSAEAHQKEMDTAYCKVKNKIHKEYAVALDHEENAAKVRIALVKGHGLKMLHSLKNRAEQTFSSMEEWLEAHYLAEMKGIDQLSKVVQHHIEAGNKLQNELVLECTDFYLNGDCQLVASQPPPPRPSPLEKPSESTLTITQLQSLHQQLSIVAPSGLIPSSEFSSLLRDIISVNRSRNTLPELWINKNETQWMEIVYLLTDDYELIDWRRFLLSAALPWPVPSLSQLLVVLRRFKAADPGKSGYINEKQYLQTELWFSFESVQPITEDPSEPPPYDRLANLHKFFFQLFADHSISPPQLDYVSMLQYFAADPNPRQGFIRALCVALGKHLKHPSPCHLVKSMPRIEEASELDSSEVDGEYKEEETQYASESLPGEQEVSIPVLLTVIGQNIAKTKDSDPVPPGCPHQEEHAKHLVHAFRDLGYKPEDCVPFSILCQHPFIQSLMETSTRYQLLNIHTLLLAHQNDGEADNMEGF